jgi:histidinol dehydrogenase
MISTFEVNRQEDIEGVLGEIRGGSAVPDEVVRAISDIIADVRENGDNALAKLTERYDGVSTDASNLEVPADVREAAWQALHADVREALELSEGRIAAFARGSLPDDWEMEAAPGLTVGVSYRPLDTVGIYVPGGRFPYPSTVLMTGVLAREAGVGEIVFCVPPGPNGEIDPATLGATRPVGDCRVFKCGGAQAIAAMAYGTASVPRCRMVAGPGNVYVTCAKRLLSGVVSIDLEAGPSEVAAYVDSQVDLSFPAADMLAQLEHDPLSAAVMVSESSEVLESARGISLGLAEREGGGETVEGTLAFVRCASRELSIRFINEFAPEHLELMVSDAREVVAGITSAGAVFVGPYSAAAMGDYVAGPSHVLPTAGTASRLSGLNAGDFRRSMNVISYTEDGFRRDAPTARLLAGLEGLGNHALSIDIRNRS